MMLLTLLVMLAAFMLAFFAEDGAVPFASAAAVLLAFHSMEPLAVMTGALPTATTGAVTEVAVPEAALTFFAHLLQLNGHESL